MTTTISAPVDGTGAWLAAQSLGRPAELATAMRLIAVGNRSNDACLHARQYLERALGASPDRPLTAADYLNAAYLLHREPGTLALGEVMESLASADAELQATARAWHARYATRPPTEAERQAEAKLRTGEVTESGQAGQGIDGAHYTRAYYPRSGKPAIVITTSALTEEVVNFANREDALAWLVSRSPEAAGPLRTPPGGPATRTAREEELLAYLIREPGAVRELAALTGAATWTTHLRAEVFAAVRWLTADGGDPGFGVIAAAYQRRLLRAPGTAASDIGWPGATRAMSYLHRLAATPATEVQAAAAARELAAADTAAAKNTQAATLATATVAATAASRPTRQVAETRFMQPPPPQPLGRGPQSPRL
jgi:hypothetical protein